MHFSSAAVSAFLLAVGGAAAFSRSVPSSAFVRSQARIQRAAVAQLGNGLHHGTGCPCDACSGRTSLFMADAVAETDSAEEEAAPSLADEEADGIESREEAHNLERPARQSLKKKKPRPGKPLSDFSVGDMVATAKVKTLTAYGAFVDIGAQSDGLLHISQLSTDFVSDVKEVLSPGQEVEVRILKIDPEKNQVALSLLTEEEEEQAREAAESRPQRQRRDRPQSNRRDDNAVLAQISEKGWDPEQFVEGTVVSTVDFGAFVRIDVSQLNSEVEGEVDGLVRISALSAGRTSAVTDVVNVDDKVQVRVRDVADRKVSLTMLSVEDEKTKMEASGGGGRGGRGGAGASQEVEGAKDWAETLAKMRADMPEFENRPLVVDLRE